MTRHAPRLRQRQIPLLLLLLLLLLRCVTILLMRFGVSVLLPLLRVLGRTLVVEPLVSISEISGRDHGAQKLRDRLRRRFGAPPRQPRRRRDAAVLRLVGGRDAG